MNETRQAALTALLAASAPMLHGIASRSDAARLAAELARLNDAVMAAARGTLTPFDQPGDFGAALLRNADPVDRG